MSVRPARPAPAAMPARVPMTGASPTSNSIKFDLSGLQKMLPTQGTGDEEEIVKELMRDAPKDNNPVKVKADGLLLGLRVGPLLYVFDDDHDNASGSLFSTMKSVIESAAAQAKVPKAKEIDVSKKTVSNTVVRVRATRAKAGDEWTVTATAKVEHDGKVHETAIVPVGDVRWAF